MMNKKPTNKQLADEARKAGLLTFEGSPCRICKATLRLTKKALCDACTESKKGINRVSSLNGISNRLLSDLASKLGHKTFIGTPCKVCDNKVRVVCERYHCVECHRKRSKAYGMAHRNEVNQNTRQWAMANAEYIKNAREAKR